MMAILSHRDLTSEESSAIWSIPLGFDPWIVNWLCCANILRSNSRGEIADGRLRLGGTWLLVSTCKYGRASFQLLSRIATLPTEIRLSSQGLTAQTAGDGLIFSGITE